MRDARESQERGQRGLWFDLQGKQDDANARIDPSIGPIHGVQPNPKAIPIININIGLVDLFV